jgi:hypothetical protein
VVFLLGRHDEFFDRQQGNAKTKATAVQWKPRSFWPEGTQRAKSAR